jgi:VanZ family protein
MTKLYQTLLRAMPAIFWSLLIITSVLMLIELPPKQGGWPHWDKLQHALVFLVLTLLGTIAYTSKKYYLAVGLIAYGASTELLQGMFTITRLASINDWLADVVGVCIGLLIFTLFQKMQLSSQHERV